MQGWRPLVHAGLFGLALALAYARAAGADAPLPKVMVDATVQDFGRVPRGTVISRKFVIRNVGTAPLRVESMEFSTPGMRARVASVIEPGASADAEVTWDTRHYTREAEGQAALVLNDPLTPQLVLTLSGYVVSPIDIEPMPAFYLSQFRGERSSQTVTIRNNRPQDLRITGVEQEAESFDLAVGTEETGRVYSVTATARADLAPGKYFESARILTDDPERPRLRLDVNILVKQDVHVSVDAIDMGQVRISALRANPSILDLLRQTVMVESRSSDLQIVEAGCDLPFVTVEHEPRTPTNRVRVDVGLDSLRLIVGQHSGTIQIRTNQEAARVITLPVRITIAER